MEAAVVAAIVTAGTSLLVSLASAYFSAQRDAAGRRAAERGAQQAAETQRGLEVLRDELDRLREEEQQRRTAKAELDRLREPLLLAAVDLGQRLHNIRRRGFLGYVGSQGRWARPALLGTLYRLAVYLSVVEELRDRTSLLHFDTDVDTREVQSNIANVGKTLATDRFGDDFMLWREQQRAVAEQMRDGKGGRLGFASFTDRFDDALSPWLSGFADDLTKLASAADPSKSERLTRLQQALGALADRLDTERLVEDEWRYLTTDENPNVQSAGDTWR